MINLKKPLPKEIKKKKYRISAKDINRNLDKKNSTALYPEAYKKEYILGEKLDKLVRTEHLISIGICPMCGFKDTRLDVIKCPECYTLLKRKLTVKTIMPVAIPWVIIRHEARADCLLWSGVYFNVFGIIPKGCRDCWKVVIKPDNVRQLFELEEIMTHPRFDFPCKLGMDIRKYTDGNWAAFLYATSKEEAQTYLDQIMPYLPQKGGKVIYEKKPIVKRGCTEMEQKLPVENWDMVAQATQDVEDFLDTILVPEMNHPAQPEWAKKIIRCSWLRFAFQIRDKSYKDVVGDDVVLFPDYRDFSKAA